MCDDQNPRKVLGGGNLRREARLGDGPLGNTAISGCSAEEACLFRIQEVGGSIPPIQTNETDCCWPPGEPPSDLPRSLEEVQDSTALKVGGESRSDRRGSNTNRLEPVCRAVIVGLWQPVRVTVPLWQRFGVRWIAVDNRILAIVSFMLRSFNGRTLAFQAGSTGSTPVRSTMCP